MGLIRLEFDSWKTKVTAMPTIIASSRFPDKLKLLGRAQDGESLEAYAGCGGGATATPGEAEGP